MSLGRYREIQRLQKPTRQRAPFDADIKVHGPLWPAKATQGAPSPGSSPSMAGDSPITLAMQSMLQT